MNTQNKKPGKEIALGQLRETLAIVGSLFFGTMSGWESLAGLIVAIAAVVWGFWQHEGKETIFSSMRKVLSIAPGVAVACGWLPAKFEPILVSMLVPMLSLVWSYKANGGKQKFEKGGIVPLLLFSFSLCLLSSCGTTVDLENQAGPNAIRGTITGVVLESDEQGKLTPKVDRQTVLGWLGKITRIAAGENIKEVILPPAPSAIIGQK